MGRWPGVVRSPVVTWVGPSAPRPARPRPRRSPPCQLPHGPTNGDLSPQMSLVQGSLNKCRRPGLRRPRGRPDHLIHSRITARSPATNLAFRPAVHWGTPSPALLPKASHANAQHQEVGCLPRASRSSDCGTPAGSTFLTAAVSCSAQQRRWIGLKAPMVDTWPRLAAGSHVGCPYPRSGPGWIADGLSTPPSCCGTARGWTPHWPAQGTTERRR